MRSLFAALLLGLLLTSPLAADEGKAVKRYVTLDGTRLLKSPAAFSKAVTTLKKGQAVMAAPSKNGYVKVSVDLDSGTKTGWLPLRAIQDNKPKMTASAKVSTDASAEEVAAATKGFNKQIETDLRAKDSKGGYDKLDKGLERTTVDDPAGSTQTFREKGKLGEFKEGGE